MCKVHYTYCPTCDAETKIVRSHCAQAPGLGFCPDVVVTRETQADDCKECLTAELRKLMRELREEMAKLVEAAHEALEDEDGEGGGK